MVIGYIKQERKVQNLFRGIEIRSFDNNYIITIYNAEKYRTKKRLVRFIHKLGIEAVVFSKELDGEFKREICEMMNGVRIVNGRKLMEYMGFDIFEYILNKQQVNMKQEDIYIIFKRDSNLNLNLLKIFIENFRVANIVTNDIEKLKNVQENLLENDNILISVSNNKKKALKRAKYVLNINLTKNELEKYKINREAIIVDVGEDVKYASPSFDGINISYFDITAPDELVEKFESIGGNFELVKLYESALLKDELQKAKIEDVYDRIKRDEIAISELIGNNGRITDEELQKIHNLNLDKMRKLV